MDYLSSLRPIFAYAAHLRLTQKGQPCGTMPQDAITCLEELLARAHAEGSSAPGQGFSQAWLAVTAWLDEAFALGLTERYFPGVQPGSAFFDTLDLLLADDRNKTASAGVIKIYATALDLRFTGNRSAPASLPELEIYRRRCRKALLRLLRPVAPLPKPLAPGRPVLAKAASAMLWLTPPAVTICLYAFYRMLLADLYASVVG